MSGKSNSWTKQKPDTDTWQGRPQSHPDWMYCYQRTAGSRHALAAVAKRDAMLEANL